jgi:hypothetical protein
MRGMRFVLGGVVSWRGRSRCGGARRGGGDAAGVAVARWRGGEEAPDRWGPGVSGGEREKTPRTEGVKSRRKRISPKYANNARAERLGSACGLGCGTVGQAAWAGRKAKAGWLGGGRPAGPKARKGNKKISEFKLDF